MSDKYDEEIKYLRKYATPFILWEHWNGWDALFQNCDRDNPCTNSKCGCLTQVRHKGALAATEVLTVAIRADERIPNQPLDPYGIASDAEVRTRFTEVMSKLEVFAEWQRKLDKELH